MASAAPVIDLDAVGQKPISPTGFRFDGALWRFCCGVADRKRVRLVPPPPAVLPAPVPILEEACLDPAALADPRLLYPAPAAVRPEWWETVDESDGVELEQLVFASPAPFGIAPNDRVVVHFYRPARRPPVFNVLVLHGIWRQDRDFEHRLCRDLAQAGVSCALMTLPFHWDRAPLDAPSGAYFLTADPVWGAAAFRQALVDARGLLGLLRGRGVPVGVVGFSLGGILAHLLMALEPLDLGVSALAGGNIAGIVWESILTRAHRLAMEARGVTLSRLAALWGPGNPTCHAERARPPKMRMVSADYDRLIPRRFTEELWRASGEPHIRWLPSGHITAFLFRKTMVTEILGAMGLQEATTRARLAAPRSLIGYSHRLDARRRSAA